MTNRAAILKKIEPINDLLESRFGLRIEFDSDHSSDHFKEVCERYDHKREILIKTLGESAALRSADYAKAFLISEGARMILKEIMPRRPKLKKNKDV